VGIQASVPPGCWSVLSPPSAPQARVLRAFVVGRTRVGRYWHPHERMMATPFSPVFEVFPFLFSPSPPGLAKKDRQEKVEEQLTEVGAWMPGMHHDSKCGVSRHCSLCFFLSFSLKEESPPPLLPPPSPPTAAPFASNVTFTHHTFHNGIDGSPLSFPCLLAFSRLGLTVRFPFLPFFFHFRFS